MALFPVSAQKEKNLLERMHRCGILESDLQETFTRSSGAGGQKVNKSDTCVILHHPRTKTTIKCQIARTQGLNRFLARRILIEKVEAQALAEKRAEQRRREKIRRQKKRRSRRAKAKMLKDKKIQSHKKQLRRTVSSEDD